MVSAAVMTSEAACGECVVLSGVLQHVNPFFVLLHSK